MHLGPHFCKGKDEEDQNSPMCAIISFISTVGGTGKAQLSHLGAHLKRCLLSPRRTKLHVWLLPQGKHVGADSLHEEGKGGSTGKRGRVHMGSPAEVPSILLTEKASRFTILKSDMRWPDGVFNPYFFLCVQLE